jgi:hypothetical protein
LSHELIDSNLAPAFALNQVVSEYEISFVLLLILLEVALDTHPKSIKDLVSHLTLIGGPSDSTDLSHQ